MLACGDDSGISDGGNDATTADSGDSTDGGTNFACGTSTCNSATDYCLKINVGPDGGLPVDAGLKTDAASPGDTCQAYPVTCTADGGTPTCSCVQGNCSCADDAGAITVSCP